MESRQFQLKNFISTANPNIIYYASSNEVYSLDLSTRKRKLIERLPWKPFCLDAAHSWICVGGDENGQCAFIRIDETCIGDNSSQSHAEVDDLLPLDLDPEYRHARQDLRRIPQWSHFSSRPKYELQHEVIGKERINSIKIHRLASSKPYLKHEIVAVIT